MYTFPISSFELERVNRRALREIIASSTFKIDKLQHEVAVLNKKVNMLLEYLNVEIITEKPIEEKQFLKPKDVSK